jgi:hypothetical protein
VGRNSPTGQTTLDSLWIAEKVRYGRDKVLILRALPLYCGLHDNRTQYTSGLQKTNEISLSSAELLRLAELWSQSDIHLAVSGLLSCGDGVSEVLLECEMCMWLAGLCS